MATRQVHIILPKAFGTRLFINWSLFVLNFFLIFLIQKKALLNFFEES